MSKQIAIPQATAQPIAVGQKQVVKIAKGQHATVQDLINGTTKDASDVIATKRGSDLNLKFVDGTELQVSNYYTECAGNACSIMVGGDKGGFLINADGAAGAAAADGSQLVYAYGEQSSLMSMATADASVSGALGSLGAGTVSYVPAASALGAAAVGGGLSLGTLGAGAAGLGAAAAAGGGSSGTKESAGVSSATSADTTAPVAGALNVDNYHDDGVSNSDRIGSDRSFDLSLSGQEAGATVRYEVSNDNGANWRTTTAAQSNLTDGHYQFRAVVTDAAGNSANTAAVALTVDTTAPAAGTLGFTGYTDTGASDSDGIGTDREFNLSLSGQEAGATVSYQVSTDNGASWASTTVAQSNLAEGSYQFRAVVTDAAGNAANTTPVALTVDTSAPAAGALALTGYADSGASDGDHVSTDRNFSLSLSGQEADTTTRYDVSTDNGESWTRTSAAQSGLADGSYQFRAVATDTAGNSASTAAVAVTVDTTAPAPGALGLTGYVDSGASGNDRISSDRDFNLSVSGQEAGATVSYQVSTNNGVSWASTPMAQSGLADGPYQFRAVVTDAAGNSSNTTPVAVTVDTTAPSTGVLDLSGFTDSGTSASDRISTDRSFNLSVNGHEANASINYQVSTDNGASWTNTTAAQSNLADGRYQFGAVVTDAAGNSANTAAQTVTIDTTAPAAVGLLMQEDTGEAGDASTANGLVNVSLGEDAVAWEYSVDGGGTWVVGEDTSFTLADGTYGAADVRARQTDAAGNTSPVQYLGAITVQPEGGGDIGSNPGTSGLTYDIGNGDRNGDGFIDGGDAFDDDELFDDPLTFAGTDAAAYVRIGDRINGLTVVSNFVPGETELAIPPTFGGYGNDRVDDAQFEVYYGTYADGIFTVTSTPRTTSDPRGATHTMMLYDNDATELVEFVEGLVFTGVYAENQWQVLDEGTVDARIIYRPLDADDIDSENVFYGTSGDDSIFSGEGIDIVFGGDGHDMIEGGWEDDVLYGDGGNDSIFGEGHADLIYGGEGEDLIDGGQGDDVLYGDEGTDFIFGEDGVDIIYGGIGDDFIEGGEGADRITGGEGADFMAGGTYDHDGDVDTFVYNGVDDSNMGGGAETDLARISSGDIFDFAEEVGAVAEQTSFSNFAGATVSLADLDSVFQANDDGITNIEAMLIGMTGEDNGLSHWLVVDTDADAQITAADYVIRLEATADFEFFAGLQLANGNVQVVLLD